MKLIAPCTGLKIEGTRAKIAIVKAIDQEMAVAELEPLGVTMRTISGLESKLGIIYLTDLLDKTVEEIRKIKNLGVQAVRELEIALNNLHKLTEKRKKSFGFEVAPLLSRAKQMRTHKAAKTEPIYDYKGRRIE